MPPPWQRDSWTRAKDGLTLSPDSDKTKVMDETRANSNQDGADFPTLENQAGITESERAEIQAHIETVATENRIPVGAARYSLKGVRRGVILPVIVNAAAAVAVAALFFLIVPLFKQGERGIAAQATEYASVEGRLIRELRQESRQALSTKEKEIEEVREKLRELEKRQADLERTFSDRLKQREAEFQRLLKEEVEAERARLVERGVGEAEIDKRLKKFEAERKAYYDKQLAEFKKKLDAERAQLQADIDRLRAEYKDRVAQLEKEQQKMVTDYQSRESALKAQLEQKTQVMERLKTENVQDLEAARKELETLNRRQEQSSAVEDQIDGQIGRIRALMADGKTEEALAKARALQEYLSRGNVRSATSIADRLNAESFLLDQLVSLLEGRVGGLSELQAGSVTEETALLDRIHELAERAGVTRDPTARLEIYRMLLEAVPEMNAASAALMQAAVEKAVKSERDAAAKRLEEELVASRAALEKEKSRAAAAEAGAAADRIKELDALAAKAKTTRQQLSARIGALIAFEDQVAAARKAYSDYTAQEKAARASNPADAVTASRQELNKFLRNDIVRGLFTDLADKVGSLYTEIQNAGSSAALADAAEIVTDVVRQPTIKAGRSLLQIEIADAKDNARLAEILGAVDKVLEKAQSSGAE